ncbi:hypothetical protein EYC98_08290 [Halieaceae bacterium IMCC14734]|uniref:DUF4012 domain-containing protein n=1 Tax=Candidatus Litorirhabdus singularis TaxID=2518993 RepID=A0ABT3THK4_9GAMM|nr:hypothetical protein [Candidatus Litorirhabdus singularis]MCX2980867.1 hypothetical protein [Candidatus Litorirhabdus singularis]
MLLLSRKLKHGHFMRENMRKYLLYGVGEILLIIIGIMIALQIDNWNTERQQETMLESYLHVIAGNMRDDAGEIDELRKNRTARVLDATRVDNIIGRIDYSYNVAEIYFFNRVAAAAGKNLYFNADTSGYEALNNSGIRGRLQGRDVERLLSKYYDQVSHIENLEKRFNELVNSLNRDFLLSYPDTVAQWEFRSPRALTQDRFEEMQPVWARIINGAAVRELINLQWEASAIVREYDKLMQLGIAFTGMLESGNSPFDDLESLSILGIDQIDDWPLHAALVTGGQLSVQFYNLQGVADGFEPIFTFRSYEKVDDSLHLQYPGSDSWAAIWIEVSDIQDDRAVLDFSHFEKLVLELKGDAGSEIISVHIKDRYLSDAVAPESVELQLTDAWQWYEIDLTTFKNTDLSKLISPLGFAFAHEPQSFSLRNARYVIAD